MITTRRTRSQPLVSVVMPVYNPHPAYFRKALQSILGQRLADWELIIVEDPGARSAGEILQALADDRIHYIANPRRTCLVDQRNRGLQQARGQFIAMMDSDDIAHPFRLVKQLNFLRSHPEVDVVGSQVSVIDAEDRIVGHRWYPASHDDILCALPRSVAVHQPAVMLRRGVVDSFGGYRFVDFAAAEDYAYWSRLIQSGVRFANYPEALLYYRIHDGQIKLRELQETILAVLRVKELYWSARLDFRSRLHIWGEHLLLYLPKRVVIWLLRTLRWHYRSGAKCAATVTPG